MKTINSSNNKHNIPRKLTIKTRHGDIATPAFLPDATYGSINSLSFEDARSANVEEIVTTTLHLELKLGSDYIQEMGGLHKFFSWDRPILTDSGGFQVFSLIHRRNNNYNRIDDEGAYFKDPRTGKGYKLTPEKSLEIQHKLDSDIRVVLDEPLALSSIDQNYNLISVERTTKWAKRSKDEFLRLLEMDDREFSKTDGATRPLLGAVIQGAGSKELRKKSLEELVEIGFDTYNFGGLPIKPDGSLDLELAEYLVSLIPENKVRYAMGIGTPDDMIHLSKMGWDIFDCVIPTRNARHGYLFVPPGEGDKDYENYSVMHIKTERYKYSDKPISSKTHPALKNISRAYLRHLIRIGEPSGLRMATLNNLWFYSEIMRELRGEEIRQ